VLIVEFITGIRIMRCLLIRNLNKLRVHACLFQLASTSGKSKKSAEPAAKEEALKMMEVFNFWTYILLISSQLICVVY